MGAPPRTHDTLKVTGQGRFHLQQTPPSFLLGSGVGHALLFGQETCSEKLSQDGSPSRAPFSSFFATGVFVRSNWHHITRFLSVRIEFSEKSLIYPKAFRGFICSQAIRNINIIKITIFLNNRNVLDS
jgi:hypothetical protein